MKKLLIGLVSVMATVAFANPPAATAEMPKDENHATTEHKADATAEHGKAEHKDAKAEKAKKVKKDKKTKAKAE